ncbi:TRAP transporter small permease [Marinobacterium sediminicola]|uniref:TRAP transporter small permease protein n=1 Tax=Marinobacterium sediminicola TaxID=518898 RepID=A0ABY1S2E9_9GAMM|nr:TRAP transporter small permease [Marinobacterium sediminicola]ULG68522.1 TRAP transporter small permease [Marinobacterium sediminicola]SMR76648.1 TRAP-type C4-dicarboxylate transport system, small permease component [Marinobacterium sediminicola]
MSALKDKLYLASGYLSGACIVAIMLLILAQIVGRFFGFIIPSAEDFAGYSLAASIFFGLAYTFREAGHIRVTLAIQRLPLKWRRAQEFAVLLFGLVLSGFMAWYCWFMVWESYVFEEMTHGYIAMPLWAPQVPLGLGASALTLAVLDALVDVLRGGLPNYVGAESEVNLEEA